MLERLEFGDQRARRCVPGVPGSQLRQVPHHILHLFLVVMAGFNAFQNFQIAAKSLTVQQIYESNTALKNGSKIPINPNQSHKNL